MAELVAGFLQALAEFGHFSTGDFGFSCSGGAVFDEEFLPAEEGFIHAGAGTLHHGVDRVGDRGGLGEQFRLQQAVMLGDLRFEDFFLGHGAEVAGQTEFVQNPDRPLGGIVLPRFDAIPVVILELVVEVVVALAKGENRHEEAVTRRAMGGIRTVADPVAERVDAEGRVVHEHDTGEAGEQERAEGGIGPTIDVADDRRQAEAHENGDRHIVFVLQPGEAVFLQIPHPCERRVGAAAEEKPADVGMKKTARNVIGVVIVVHEFVVAAVVC